MYDYSVCVCVVLYLVLGSSSLLQPRVVACVDVPAATRLLLLVCLGHPITQSIRTCFAIVNVDVLTLLIFFSYHIDFGNHNRL